MKSRNKVISALAGVGLLLGGMSLMAGTTATPPSAPLTNNGKSIAQIDIAAINGGVISYESPFGSKVKKNDIVLKLDPTQYVAQVDLDKAKLLNDIQIYERNLQLNRTSKNGVISDQDLLTSKYAVLEDQAQVKLDQSYVDQCVVKAPFDGTVTNIVNYTGSGVGSGNEIMDITAN
ncbi:MAG: hypothetical protein GY756_20035 [bacterium]|nr:hypothetical protein [bacterium]